VGAIKIDEYDGLIKKHPSAASVRDKEKESSQMEFSPQTEIYTQLLTAPPKVCVFSDKQFYDSLFA